METCVHYFPRKDIQDRKGCILDLGHEGEHVCFTSSGEKVAWEFDYECDCGCWEDVEEEYDCGCINYRHL